MKKVNVTDFGKDHWSLLAYIETLCVDSGKGGIGEIDKLRVRCNPKRHPLHAVSSGLGPRTWKPEYGTRLTGFWKDDKTTDPKRQLKSHDDWDCLYDLEMAGLLAIISEVNGFVRLTRRGIRMTAEVRAHKAQGGVFATFRWVDETEKEVKT